MTQRIAVSQLLDIPETGGEADEIGGHVEISDEDDQPSVTCPHCEADVTERTTGHVCNDEFRAHPAGEPGGDGGRSA